MNQSLLNPEFNSYELCRQQSQCYLLIPPPEPPIFPKLILTKNLHQQIDSFFIIFVVFITLTSACLLLFLLDIKFQFYRKFRRTKDKPSSFSSIVPTFYNSLTPTTNQSPSHPINIYEEIRLSSDYYHYQMPCYELSPSKIICQNCLLETLHRKQQCVCHNFFVPIKYSD